jgi:Leucine-rich repeat (LRR) protein
VGYNPDLRYLHARGSGLSLRDFSNSALLVYLNLAACGIHDLQFPTLKNLLVLNLSDNLISAFKASAFRDVPSLQSLSLANNPLTGLLHHAEDYAILSLERLDLSFVIMEKIDLGFFSMFPNLHVLNLSESGLDRVLEGGFQNLQRLKVLDLTGCPMTQFPHDVFQGLDELQAVHADNYKLCCPATLPAGYNKQR